MSLTSTQIRQTFLDFFQSKKHEIVPSAPMVLKNDPTLMFTNAGMNQFKDYFLGNSVPKSKRIADTQKCLRVSGKHNDLEEVGVDTYHHTMFEMLGNWSFGDYFKKEAIDWAWELLVDTYKIDTSRIYVTVFGGDKKDELPADDEAAAFWEKYLDKNRILKFSKKDNFWEMGDTGPCGPCSEIHVDIRSDEDRKNTDGKELVNTGHPQVVEIWNLVFIQFERKADGKLVSLPAKHIDTGMGFERLCMVLQGKKSNYDTDVFMPIINFLEKQTSFKYGENDKTDIAFRVVADHIRAIAFAIADGQLPSNIGAGFVIRRILRRAVRYGYSFLNQKEAFVYNALPLLVNQFGKTFPELKSQQEIIQKVIKEEEDNFFRTLEKGMKRINDIITNLRVEGKNIISGKYVFDLHSTYGFPNDLTELIARENGMEINKIEMLEEFDKEIKRAQEATKLETGDWQVISKEDKSEFIGYDNIESTVNVVKYRKVKSKGKEQYQLVFNKTPFYAESGGQVGDTGYIEVSGAKIFITDTKKENELIVHFSNSLPKDLKAEFTAVVDSSKRKSTQANHSATHLLHQALRTILGEHVQQKGSLVHPDYLRFDFSHFQKLSETELQEVEEFVNKKIRENISLDESRNTPIEEAKKQGAMALFGEKYGDTVRVVRFGSSVELCGGTHVANTAEIGMFKIISESSVAAGIRRIEAITSAKADEYIRKKMDELKQLAGLLKNPTDSVKALSELIASNTILTKQVETFNKEKAGNLKNDLLAKATEVNGIKFIAEKISLDAASVKDLAFALKSQIDNLFLVFGTENNGKANITVALSDSLVNEKGFNAGNIVRELAKEINGGGGGQAFFATAGGSNISGIERALKKAKSFLN